MTLIQLVSLISFLALLWVTLPFLNSPGKQLPRNPVGRVWLYINASAWFLLGVYGGIVSVPVGGAATATGLILIQLWIERRLEWTGSRPLLVSASLVAGWIGFDPFGAAGVARLAASVCIPWCLAQSLGLAIRLRLPAEVLGGVVTVILGLALSNSLVPQAWLPLLGGACGATGLCFAGSALSRRFEKAAASESAARAKSGRRFWYEPARPLALSVPLIRAAKLGVWGLVGVLLFLAFRGVEAGQIQGATVLLASAIWATWTLRGASVSLALMDENWIPAQRLAKWRWTALCWSVGGLGAWCSLKIVEGLLLEGSGLLLLAEKGWVAVAFGIWVYGVDLCLPRCDKRASLWSASAGAAVTWALWGSWL